MRIVVIIVLFISTTLIAQNKPYYYAVKTNLLDHRINAIQQDEYGRLIIGTDKGLYSYNGYQSQKISTSNLYSPEIVQLLRIGKLVVGLTKSGQVFTLKNGEVKVLPIPNTHPITKLREGRSHHLLLGCSDAVFVVQLNSFRVLARHEVPFYEKGKAELIDFQEGEEGMLGLLSSNEVVDFENQLAMTVPGGKVQWMLKSEGKILVIPSRPTTQAVYEFQGKRFRSKSRVGGIMNHDLQHLVSFGSQLALLSETGITLVQTSNLKVQSQLVGFNVISAYKDASQTIWFGTATKGLFCIPAGNFQLLNTSEFRSLELSNDSTHLMAQNNLGQLVMLQFSGQLKGGNPLATATKRVTLFQTNFSLPFTIGEEIVQQICQIGEGRYLLATSKGVFAVEAEHIKEFKKKLNQIGLRTKIVDSPVKEWVQNGNQEVLFASVDGLHLLQLKDLKHHTITYFNQSIEASQIVARGNQWVVLTPNSRLFVIHNGKVSKDINFRDSGSTLLVSKIKLVGDWYYLLTDKALYRTKELHGKLERLNELSLLPDLLIRDFLVVRDKVYLSTQFGLFRFEWSNKQIPFPPLLIGKPVGDEQREEQSVFKPQNTVVTIPFELVDLMGNHPFSIQYRLIRNGKTSSEKWKTALPNVSALSFEHLRSGSYVLELRLSETGTSSVSKINQTSFRIEASWYEDVVVWFLFGVILGFFIFLYLRGRRRLRRLRRLRG